MQFDFPVIKNWRKYQRVFLKKKTKQIHVYMRFNITKWNYWIAWKKQTLNFLHNKLQTIQIFMKF